MKRYFILGIIIFALIFQIGCAKKETPTTPTPVTDEKGSVYLSIQNAPAQISTTTGYVYATNMDTVLSNLTKSGSTITGTITNIPVGNSRYLRIDAMDSSGLLIYRGTSSVFSVSVNQTTQVSIILYALTGNVQVNGTVDTGSIPTEGLMAYYPFNGNANDASGNSNNGTVIGGATLTTDRFGNANTAYLFDGVDDYIRLTTAESLGFYNHDFTACAWINLSRFSGPDPYGNNDETVFGSPVYSGSNTQLCLFIRNKYPFFSFFGNDLNGSDTLSINTTYFVVWRYNKTTGEMAIFVNGNMDASDTNRSPYIGTSEILIGKLEALHYFDGTIDDIRIYNRVLTQLEIQSLFREGGWTGQ